MVSTCWDHQTPHLDHLYRSKELLDAGRSCDGIVHQVIRGYIVQFLSGVASGWPQLCCFKKSFSVDWTPINKKRALQIGTYRNAGFSKMPISKISGSESGPMVFESDPCPSSQWFQSLTQILVSQDYHSRFRGNKDHKWSQNRCLSVSFGVFRCLSGHLPLVYKETTCPAYFPADPPSISNPHC